MLHLLEIFITRVYYLVCKSLDGTHDLQVHVSAVSSILLLPVRMWSQSVVVPDLVGFAGGDFQDKLIQ